MVMSVEQRSKFAALHRQWWRLQMREKFSSGTKKSKQTNLIEVRGSTISQPPTPPPLQETLDAKNEKSLILEINEKGNEANHSELEEKK